MPSLFATLALLLIFFFPGPHVLARIKIGACAGGHCVEPNSRNGACLNPGRAVFATTLPWCSNNTIRVALDNFVAAQYDMYARTLVYVNASDPTSRPLGDWTWSVDEWPEGRDRGDILLCVVGHGASNKFMAACWATDADDYYDGDPGKSCQRFVPYDRRVVRERCCDITFGCPSPALLDRLAPLYIWFIDIGLPVVLNWSQALLGFVGSGSQEALQTLGKMMRQIAG